MKDFLITGCTKEIKIMIKIKIMKESPKMQIPPRLSRRGRLALSAG